MILENEEIFFLDFGDETLVYTPLRSYLVLIKTQMLEKIQHQESSPIKSLFFQRIKEKKLLNINEMIASSHARPPQLSLAITENCNLCCVYCHALAGESNKQKTMTHEMADSILNHYFAQLPGKKIKISFNGGGEPTFAFEMLQYVIKRANHLATEKNVICKFSMSTNGFYGESIRAFIVKNFSSVSLSLDGPEFIQNVHRPAKTGEASFETVFQTAKYFYDTKFPFAFRITVSSYSLNYLKEIVDFFVDNFPYKPLSLEILNPVGRALICSDSKIVAPDKKIFAHKLLEILKYIEGKPIKILNSASTEFNKIRPYFCSNVAVPNWTVTTDGNIMACARDNASEQFVFGKYDEVLKKVSLNLEKMEKIRNMNVLHYTECQNCFCKYHCAGDCFSRRITDKSDCESIRNIGKYILYKKIHSKTKG